MQRSCSFSNKPSDPTNHHFASSEIVRPDCCMLLRNESMKQMNRSSSMGNEFRRKPERNRRSSVGSGFVEIYSRMANRSSANRWSEQWSLNETPTTARVSRGQPQGRGSVLPRCEYEQALVLHGEASALQSAREPVPLCCAFFNFMTTCIP